MPLSLNKDIRVVLKNSLYLFILQIINVLIPLVTIPYLINVVGEDFFGLIAFSVAVMTYLNLIIDFGFGYTATNQISICKNDLKKINRIFNSVMAIKLFLLLLLFLILVFAVNFYGNLEKYKYFYLLSYGMVIGQAIFPIWFFQGIQKMEYVTIINVISKIIFTICIFVFVNKVADFFLVPFFYSLGYLFSGFLSLYIARKKFNILFYWTSLDELKEQFFNGIHVFSSTFAISIYTALIPVILGIICGNTAVGNYSISEKIIQAIKAIYHPISVSIYPHLSKKIAKGIEKKYLVSIIKKLILIFAGPMLLICFSVFISSEIIVNIFIGNQFYQAAQMLKIMSFIPFLGVVSNIFGVQFLLNFGLKNEFTKVLILAALFGSIGSILIASKLGPIGIPYLLLIIEFYVTVAMIFVAVKNICSIQK